jgi:hypothetical protein
MRCFLSLAALAIASWPLPGFAQFGGPGFGVEPPGPFHQVETAGGNRVTGMLTVERLKIQSDELGELEIWTGTVRSVSFDHGGDTIVTKSDARIKGTVELKELTIRSEFGTLTIPRAKLKSITEFDSNNGGRAGSSRRQFPRIAEPEPLPGGVAPDPKPAADAPRPALPDRGAADGQTPPPTERPSRPSPIPHHLIHPGPGAAAQSLRGGAAVRMIGD